MDSLSIPDKYLEETIRGIKSDFPLTYKMCWERHEHIENEIVVDSVNNEIVCVILWEQVDNGINNFTELHSIEINKRWRKGGLGSVILQEFMEDKDKIYSKFMKSAKKFYIKNGFKVFKEDPDYVYFIKEKLK